MPGFTIPNTPDPAIANTNQAEPDSVDFQILGQQTNGVISGCAVTPAAGSSPPRVAVATGEVLINGVYRTLTANPSLNLTSYGSATFFDVVIARASGASGAVAEVVSGTASGTNPQFPTIDFSNSVVLAAIWRTNNSDISSSAVVDKRMFVRSNANRFVAGTTDNSLGANGDTWVNSSWSAGINLASPFSVKVGDIWYNLARAADSFTVSGTITSGGFSTTGTSSFGAITSGAISATGNSTVTGNLTVTGTLLGNATSASKWATARTLSLIGNVTGSTTLDGSGNASINATVNYASSSNYATSSGSLVSTFTPGVSITYSAVLSRWTVTGDFYSSYDVQVTGNSTFTNSGFYLTGLGTTGSAANLRVLNDGRIAFNTSVRDIKENIQPMENGLEIIKALRPRTFSLKKGPMDTIIEDYVRDQGIPTFGFIVDEIEQDAPQLLDFIQDQQTGVIKPVMWKTNDLIAILTKAVQELSARIEALEAKK